MKITPETQPPPPDPLPPGSAILRCSKGAYAIVDADMLDRLPKVTWGITEFGYLRTSALGFLHQHVLPPKLGFETDHINGIKWDNRRANLRYATHGENMQNRKKHTNNTSGAKGVTWDKRKKRFQARISINGKEMHIGNFQTLQEAIGARAEVEQIHFKEFARPIHQQ